jgi:hypothetical protein
MVFQGLKLNPAQIAHKIRSDSSGNRTSYEKPARNLTEPEIDYEQTWGYFDGACQGGPRSMQCWCYLILESTTLFQAKTCSGPSYKQQS